MKESIKKKGVYPLPSDGDYREDNLMIWNMYKPNPPRI
jgi:hypothetical protein